MQFKMTVSSEEAMEYLRGMCERFPDEMKKAVKLAGGIVRRKIRAAIAGGRLV